MNSIEIARKRTSRLIGAMAALGLLFSGCAGAARAPVGAPAADPAAAALTLIRATSPARPQRISFTWSLNEAGARVNGRGVLRVEAPDRIRLDLFGPRNETYVAAALVDELYRLPSGAASQVALPSPAILWGGMGVIRPPAGATLVAAVSTEATATLQYRGQDGSTYQYTTASEAGATRLESVERSGGGGRLETVQISRNARGQLARAEYRNWAAFRELVLVFEEVQDVSTFPAETWQP